MHIRRPVFHPVVAALATLLATSPAGPAAAQDDALFAELADPQGETWPRAEADILRTWSRSGSAAMDFLRTRAEAELDAGDLDAAIGDLTALTDHAPDFADGWRLRAEAYALDGQYGPAAADLARTLTLQPRHWPALTQLGGMLDEIGDMPRAAEAYRRSLAIHPHQEDARDALRRLEAGIAGAEV